MLIDSNVFLLDMDGTIYLGDTLIDGAIDFLNTLDALKKSYIFVTNNSSRSPKDYIEKLHRLNISIERKQIFTSADATIVYLHKNLNHVKNIFLLGTKSLKEQFLAASYNIAESKKEVEVLYSKGERIDEIVLGFDTTLTYDKLSIACELIREKGSYIATHPDFNCPLADGKMMPDIGAMIAFIKAATEIEPIIIGKPNKMMIDAICQIYDINSETLIMVGDRLYTDILTGTKANIKSALVLSGETTKAMYDSSNIRATYVYSSVKEMAQELKKYL